MQKLPSSFNWKDSPSHFNLLLAFDKPRDIKQVLDWAWPRQTLGEKTEVAIERFVEDGLLIPASVEEGLNKLFQVAQLKKFLSERSLSISGNKAELIERLVAHDKQEMQKIVGNSIFKCSDAALRLITERNEKIEKETELAKRSTFDAFKANNPKEACKIYEAFRRHSVDSAYKISIYDVEELHFVLISQPKVLSNFSREELVALRHAACMKLLWKSELPERWLPESFILPSKNIQIAVNYLLTHAKFKKGISHYKKDEHIRLSFHPGDINSCNLCLVFNDQVFTTNTIPELPIPGFTSEMGCKCDLQWADYEGEFDIEDEDEEGMSATDLIDENLALSDSPVEALRLLTQMLNEGLVTQTEFDEKKKEILSRL